MGAFGVLNHLAQFLFLIVVPFHCSSSWALSNKSSNLHRRRSQTQTSVFSNLPMSHTTPAAKTSPKDDLQSTPPALFCASSQFHSKSNGLSRRRRWLVVDFDGTCTEHDTTPLLPKLASFAARSRSSLSHAGNDDKSNTDVEQVVNFDLEQDLQRRLSQFEQLENEFLKRYSQAKEKLLLNETDDSAEIRKSIHDVLDALDEPSTTVTHMVSASGVLRGLGRIDSNELERMLSIKGVSTTSLSSSIVDTDKREQGGKTAVDVQSDDMIEIQLRPGCETTLARLLTSHSSQNKQSQENDLSHETSCLGWSVAILSINWCPALIEASLVQPVLRKKRSLLNEQHCETEVPIWSNSVDEEGVVALHVPGALAKRDRITELRKHLEYKHVGLGDGNANDKHLIVYIGDSSTDLAALLEADIGIIMGDSISTRSIAEKWNIRILPLNQFHANSFGFGIQKNVQSLWQTESWQEINEVLIKLDSCWE